MFIDKNIKELDRETSAGWTIQYSIVSVIHRMQKKRKGRIFLLLKRIPKTTISLNQIPKPFILPSRSGHSNNQYIR